MYGCIRSLHKRPTGVLEKKISVSINELDWGWQLEWYILFYDESSKSSSQFFSRTVGLMKLSQQPSSRVGENETSLPAQFNIIKTRNHPKQDIKSKFCFDHASIVISEGFSRKECTCNIWYVDINNLRIDSSSSGPSFPEYYSNTCKIWVQSSSILPLPTSDEFSWLQIMLERLASFCTIPVLAITNRDNTKICLKPSAHSWCRTRVGIT